MTPSNSASPPSAVACDSSSPSVASPEGEIERETLRLANLEQLRMNQPQLATEVCDP